jgi:phage shock protein A
MLDQFVRDFTTNISDAETAIAESIGHLRLMQKDRADAATEHEDWGRKAQAASSRADAFRSAGREKDADKYDQLATVALRKQVALEQRVAELDPQIAQQDEVAEQLKAGLAIMRDKLSDLKDKRSELLARARAADAQHRVVDAASALNTADPTSQIGRFEEGVRKREALAQGRIEVAAASLESRFDELDQLSSSAIADDRLAALKRGEQPALQIEQNDTESESR